jgi:DNA repair exonuclease SbcCD ATPase subunit
MNLVYLLAPLLGMSIFGGIYPKYARIHATRIADLQQTEAATRAAKKAADEAAKLSALEAARLSQLRRSEERAEKERMEEQRKQARLALEDRGRLGADEVARLRSMVTNLRREADEITTSLGRSEMKKRHLHQQGSSLEERLKKAEADRHELVRLLDRIRALRERDASLTHAGTQVPNRG